MKKIFNNDKFKHGLNITILTIIVIGIVVLLNIILNRYSFKKDFSQSKIFDLAEQTKTTLKNLDKSSKRLDVTLFTIQQDYYLDLKTKNLILGLLKQYEKSSRNFNLQIVDIEKNPALAKKYNATAYDAVFDLGGKVKKISLMDMYNESQFSGEQAFTGAIINVLNENPSVVYLIQGHKEIGLADITILKKLIEQDGYIIKTVSILQNGKIPDDAEIVMDIGPKNEFNPKEIEILKSYLNLGGKGIFLMSSLYEDAKISNLNAMLRGFGVGVNNDIVEDPERSISSLSIVIPEYGNNDIVNKLKEYELAMVMLTSRSINILPEVKDTQKQELLLSSSKAWGETSVDADKNQKQKLDSNEKKGPLALSVYVTKTISPDKQMSMVVAGNDIFVTDDIIRQSSGTEPEFILNCIAQLNSKKESITIRPKPLDVKVFQLPYNKQIVLFYGLVVVIPCILFVMGIVVWLKRRHL